ncbi:hypothetical protein [Chitinophaga cymbidii]|uniref:Uncharacterized protein n=1 Tax=Chitinophaga cymbidii TaxID=1096750 RepID=A0A512RQ91_9BACT|nr:hypothetical protein [Chitinophaga cymbidii]GEP97847.1 hypothetical protein CCY01nite_41070 [Chitinophaga cymbidii]
MRDDILRKIAEKTGCPDMAGILAEKLSGTELNSLLMEVFARKAAAITPPVLLQQYRQNRFVHPADTDMIGLLEKASQVLKIYREHQFTPIELSPLAQFGSCSVVAKADQKKIISATRHTEVLADATNSIALHIADMRQNGATELLRFSTVHRHVRAQPLQDPRFSPHFSIGCLVSAGRDTGNFDFELAALKEHFSVWTDLLKNIFHISSIRFKLQPREGYPAHFLPKALQHLQESGFPVGIDTGSPANQYYKGIQFKTIIPAGDGEIEIADGGFTDWTQQLLENRKERMLISGFGLSLLYQLK